MMEYKICIDCGISKSLDEFPFRKNENKYRNQCKSCRNNKHKIAYRKRQKEFLKEHPNWLDSDEQTKDKKKCPHCKTEKSINNFYKVLSKWDGYSCWCIDCERNTKKIWRDNNKELKRKLDNEYRLKNKDKIKKRRKEYYENHKKEIIENVMKYTNEHKDERLQYLKEYREKNIDDILRKNREYRRTERGILSHRRGNSKRSRELIYEELFLNPFPKDVEFDYHHINNVIVIPLPKVTHKFCSAGQHVNTHRKKCNEWIKKIYGLDIDKLLSEEL